MKKIYFLLLIICLFGFINTNASNLSSLDIDIYINENGDADITEYWTAYANQGTEFYKPMNLEDREIKNFVVSENGEAFTYKEYWDTSKSRSEKKNTYGINHTSSGIELCWGIGEYGDHTYKVSYTLTGFVTKYSDADAFLYKAVNDNMSISPQKVSIDIKTYYELPDTIDVWGYGYKGYAYVKDGFIHAESEGSLSYSDYVVLLAKFPLGTFTTTREEDKSFDEVLNRANENTYEYDYGDGDDNNEESSGFASFISGIFNLFSVVFTFLIAKAVFSKSSINSDTFDFGPKGKVIRKEEAVYYRDIPCNKDIFRAYYISTVYGLCKKNTNLLGAVLLKWLKDKQISIQKQNNKTIVDLTKPYNGTNELESQLYSMLVAASKDHLLEENEMKKWCKSHYSKILGWFDKVLKDEKEKLIAENKLILIKKNIFGSKYQITDEFRNEAVQLQGLKNFFNDFTIIKERYAIEVITFEYYLMYAQIFGIAKQVAEDFKKIYPNLLEADPNFTLDNYYIISNISDTGTSAARAAESAARAAAESYSSGGGGFSSGGGGGGSFGGGSGGGIR